MDRLHAVFDGDIRALGKLAEQSEHVVGHAVWAGADYEADDLRMGEGFFVNSAEAVDGGVGIGRRLEVGEIIVALAVAQLHALEALVDLPADPGSRQSAAGAEAAIVTESATTDGNGAIDIRAREASIDTDLLHTPAVALPEVEVAGVVGQLLLAPRDLFGS